ncbi:hydroxymethylglutaryl-CoA lyase [Pseudonocardia sp. EC080619-01]|uniref:hydroxymethylglutaryl-CoA lyase n=1 Tax=Pseudonocardia sp. EC080619-01 TaxID=1096856 RepID=UPI000760C19F|nr:hydroxymethylglutaryl-CoA lyase [Pseudonocardia sp. EC080619-01]
MTVLLPDPAQIDETEVRVCEVWPRDGIQGWSKPVPTEDKLKVIAASLAAGVTEIDTTSFVSPRATAQFGDAEQLLVRMHEEGLKATVRVLTVNTRSFDRIAANPLLCDTIDVCGFPISASESHNLANLRRSHADHLETLASMIDRCAGLDLAPLFCVATAYGCPLEGVVPQDKVLELARWAYDRGVRTIMLGDTTGMADPRHAWELFSRMKRELPEAQLVAHFHDTRGSGIANTLAAIAAGVRVVDSSLGGLGGEPPSVEQNHSGESGNVCTEDLVAVLQRMGYRTGIDQRQLLEAGRLVEQVCGTALRSQVLRAGAAVAR